MAIAQGATITTSTNNGGAHETAHTFTTQHTVDSGMNLLVVFTECWDDSLPHTVSGVTWGGVALTKLTSIQQGDNSEAGLWYLPNPATGTDDIIVTNTKASEHQHIAANYSGVDTSTPFSASNSATGSSTGPTVTVTGGATGELVIGCFAFFTTGVFTTGGTLIAFLDNNGGNDSNAAQSEPGAASVVFNGTLPDIKWAVVAGSLKVDTGGGGRRIMLISWLKYITPGFFIGLLFNAIAEDPKVTRRNLINPFKWFK